MFKRLIKFFYIIKDFIFCLGMIHSNSYPINKKLRIDDYKKMWQYCKSWEEGKL